MNERLKKKGILTFLTLMILAIASPSLGETKFNINSDIESITAKDLILGRVKVMVSYTQSNPQTETNNLQYKIYYDHRLQVDESAYTRYSGSIFIQDLDANKTPEVIVKTYSGGAHCCTEYKIYSYQKGKFIKISTDSLDGEGGSFEDLGGDGKYELVTYDNSFLYKFSSYASSYPPSLIYALNNGKFTNVTRRYPNKLKSTAWDMYKTVMRNKQENSEINGVLAGYVAQKALLGEFEQAWKFMLTNYDREAGRNFPNSLKALLIERGYLTQQGTAKN